MDDVLRERFRVTVGEFVQVDKPAALAKHMHNRTFTVEGVGKVRFAFYVTMDVEIICLVHVIETGEEDWYKLDSPLHTFLERLP